MVSPHFKIMDNVRPFLKPYPKNPLTEKVDCIVNYDVLDLGWMIKRWFKVDQEKIIYWYNELIKNYADWKWEYGKHKHMWEYDPNEKLGQFMRPDTSWIMLTWGNDTEGPVPWLRTVTKEEYNSKMPKNTSESSIVPASEGMGARKCFTGYAREIIESMPGGPNDIQVAIHTPGTFLPEHQDMPDKLRFHIPIYTNEGARFVINGVDLHLPADGWCYLVNTTYLHYVKNNGVEDRVHIYGAVWTHEILNLDLNSMETVA